MNIGAHVSIAGGFDKCIDRIQDLGTDCLQTFASSPRTLAFNSIDPETIKAYMFKKELFGIQLHLFHGIYLINLAHEQKESIDRSVNSLVAYQQLAGQIGGMGTVFHVGSHKNRGLAAVLDGVGRAIVRVLEETPVNVSLFLENAAGHKGSIGQTFDELAQIIENVAKQGGDMDKLAVCIDTQHAFASGYDLRTIDGIDKMIREADLSFGFDKVKVIHANDSLTDFNSHRDRHANIGEGKIGLEGFRLIVNHKRLSNIPFFLEVPGENKSGPRASDVDTLRQLIKK